MKICGHLLVSALSVLPLVTAAETPSRFHTINGRDRFSTNDSLGTLAADEDPDGNWGLVTDGFQLSIRFSKSTYTNGEPIEALVIFRNVSDRSREFVSSSAVDRNLTFVIIDESGAVLQKRAAEFDRFQDMHSDALPIGGQTKSRHRVDAGFDFSNKGTYNVSVTRTVYSREGKSPIPVSSASAQIHVSADDSVASDRATLPNNDSNAQSIPSQKTVDAKGSPGFFIGSTREGRAMSGNPRRMQAQQEGALEVFPASATANSFTNFQRIGIGVVAGLFGLVLVVFWRALRRKTQR